MNEDILKGKWKQIGGEVLKEWGKLTKNDLDQVNGVKKILEGKIQEKYGETEEDAIMQVKKFLDKFTL